MAGTAHDVQVKIDAGIAFLNKTTTPGATFIATYGSDWTKWPQTSNWYQAYKSLYAARAEVGQLGGSVLTAAFTVS